MDGYIHSTDSFGAVDGPGVRFLIFTSGCPMRCRYCHNPDTWNMERGKKTEADELVRRALRCRPYWTGGGGVTVSGGEPLMQIDFLIDLFKKLKAQDVHTCIDTSGAPFSREEPFFSKFNELMRYTDLLLVDIKHINVDEHIKLTGRRNENILKMLCYLSDIKKSVWIRHVLVPGITDNDDYLRKTREFTDTLKNVERVEILPYHTLGIHKWDELGLDYTLRDVYPPSEERIINANEILGTNRNFNSK